MALRVKKSTLPPRVHAFNDPAWQAAKAARRNIDHNAAVQESELLLRQFRSMWRKRLPGSPVVSLNQILRVLTEKRIRFVLIGAHSIDGWTGRPRATHDVDILVKGGRVHGRTVKILAELYPHLETRQFTGVTVFFVPGETESVIDVVYPHRRAMEEALANPIWTEDQIQGLRYRIPTLEAALASKYGAMLNSMRSRRKRLMDMVDFGSMVKHSQDPGCQPIDLEKLVALGEKVWPEVGAHEILRLAEDEMADRPISLEALGPK